MVAGKSQALMERELRLHRHNEDFAAAGKHPFVLPSYSLHFRSHDSFCSLPRVLSPAFLFGSYF
jgi:hypothetical protein